MVADAYSLKEEKRIEAKGGNDWRAIAAIDENQALLTSGKGIFKLNLNTMELNGQVDGVTGQVGDIVKVNAVTGTVERIGLRSTRIRTADKTLVTVPNKQMVDSVCVSVAFACASFG